MLIAINQTQIHNKLKQFKENIKFGNLSTIQCNI
jgi:hypothetical protein